MIKSNLVPVDGSAQADKAVVLAADLTGKYGARLRLLHVMPNPGSEFIPPALQDHVRLEHGEVTERDTAKIVANEILSRSKGQAEAQGALSAETVIETGAPAEQILQAAELAAVNLIVMGSRGLSNLEGLLMGSVAQKVNHLAPCTCITVR